MKFIYLLSALALTFTFGCNKQPQEEQVKVVETETVKVVEVEKSAATPATKVVMEQEKGTSLELGPEGGSLKTKKVDIKINN
ncbi:hypothetical protein [uncultured Pontibacter sp.]|uniref:hypothetical protein n=1 Tax=uncultured Pontibacter sp. TaxID=453356 RepID=UPI00261C6420|nr:hypothetical protein [uncultured Pontibacter sp.]